MKNNHFFFGTLPLPRKMSSLVAFEAGEAAPHILRPTHPQLFLTTLKKNSLADKMLCCDELTALLPHLF